MSQKSDHSTNVSTPIPIRKEYAHGRMACHTDVSLPRRQIESLRSRRGLSRGLVAHGNVEDITCEAV